jgi:acyl transferase domain-containing protein
MFVADDNYDIAIIGMAGRFPKAMDAEAFWENLKAGVECVSFFGDEELEVSLPPETLADPAYVKAGAVIDEIEMFDADFFHISAWEAEWMDPQQRLFLERAWEAIEDAGYNLETYRRPVAVYAGANTNFYLLSRLDQLNKSDGGNLFPILLANEKDFLATRVSYKLNLKGESITIQTSCSTSLVAVHLACQSLLSGQCDMALAGGVSIRVPQKTGYRYEEGMIASPDGRCRAFDHRAQGTLPGNGLGIVVLKRASEALQDGDHIYALIKGSAINNDGRRKVGYTAPSVEGQSEVIANALAMAGVDAGTIGFVEAHGTGTTLGDPIEVESITRAFRRHTQRRQFCALGSVKTNIGHLDNAAGISGLIKAALALKHKTIPPSLHFERPNPAIDLANSPFFVNTQAVDWRAGDHPRRAGVSSFGIGGTNAHVILEEPPATVPGGPSRPAHLLTLSAKTATATEKAARRLAGHLIERMEIDLDDAVYTQNIGRQAFSHRVYVVAEGREELTKKLEAVRAAEVLAVTHGQKPKVAFMFPGQGALQVNAARGLFETEPLFRQTLKTCADLVEPLLKTDLLDLIYPSSERTEESAQKLTQPAWGLPALFSLEYALARLWMDWGVNPQALIGHSFGEYAAACLAGVFSLEGALSLAVARGRLMQKLPPGAMCAARLPASEAPRFLNGALALASINSRASCVFAGPVAEIESLEGRLTTEHVAFRRLDVRSAYHSQAVDPTLEEVRRLVEGTARNLPSLPFISSLTGRWIGAQEAISPSYWAEQMRRTVRFSDGLDQLAAESFSVLIEIGPDQTLTPLARQHLGRDRLILPTLAPARSESSAQVTILNSLGKLWQAGGEIDWAAFYKREKRHRAPLPTYPFERRRYWIETSTARAVDWRRDAAALETDSTPTPPVDAPMSGAAERHAVRREGLSGAYVAPRHELEKSLVEIWSDVLRVEGIGVDDNFFDLGGDSLTATQTLSRIRDVAAADISLQDALTNLTVADLAVAIERARNGGGTSSHTGAQAPPLQPVPRDLEPPLSYAQERLWLTSRLAPDSPMYNLPAIVRLKGPLDVAALERSFNEVIRRHEILRTAFPFAGDRATQSIARFEERPLPVSDLGDRPADEREAHAERLIGSLARKPFDLSRGPLHRVALIRLSPTDHIVAVVMHHMISDAWSMNLLFGELGEFYKSFVEARPFAPRDLPIQYADYAHWQRRWLEGETLRSMLAYWRQKLGGAPAALRLPTLAERPERRSFRGARHSFSLSKGLSAELSALSREEGCTLYMTLLAAFKTLLFRLTGQDDIVIGAPIAGRNRPETENLIGCFINTLALRTDLSGNPRFRDLLHRVRETTLAAYSRQDLPFEKLLEALRIERSLSHMPLTQALFDFINTPAAPTLDLPGLTLQSMPVEINTAKNDLVIDMWEGPDGLAGSVEYSTDLFDGAAIERMTQGYASLLRSVVSQPDARLNALELLSDEERRRRLLAAQNREEVARKRFTRPKN